MIAAGGRISAVSLVGIKIICIIAEKTKNPCCKKKVEVEIATSAARALAQIAKILAEEPLANPTQSQLAAQAQLIAQPAAPQNPSPTGSTLSPITTCPTYSPTPQQAQPFLGYHNRHTSAALFSGRAHLSGYVFLLLGITYSASPWMTQPASH